jgi:hypothetical protein
MAVRTKTKERENVFIETVGRTHVLGCWPMQDQEQIDFRELFNMLYQQYKDS